MTQGAQVRMAGMVKGSKEITTKKGDRMAFITLEDLNGTIEVTVFSDLYAKSRDLLQSGEPMIVFGTKNGEDETPKLLAQDMFHIEDAPKRMSKYMKLKLAARQTDPKQIKDLRKLLFRHKGAMPVKISVTIPGRTDTLITLGSNSCDPSDALLAELRNSFGPNAVSFE
jgi:DNA polymerase III subunit alpha